MAKTERVSVLVDEGNFYHLVLKKLGILEINFDFDAFVDLFVNGRSLVAEGKRLYVGTVREKEGDLHTKTAMAEQRRFLSGLQATGWQLKTSKLRTRIEEIAVDSRMVDYKKIQKSGVSSVRVERMREKGIDVKMATDLIVGAVDDKYDAAVVVSSDSDLVPAIDWVRMRKHKRVEYVGFSIPDPRGEDYASKPTFALIARTDIQRILVESDVRHFVKQKLLS